MRRGWFRIQKEIYISLGISTQFTFIFHCLWKKDTNRKINALPDSQAVIKALRLSESVSKKLLNFVKANEVTIIWVSEHLEIEGNEKADELAQKAANSYLIGPDSFCGKMLCQKSTEFMENVYMRQILELIFGTQ